jgi:hypothetical protein
MLCRKFPSRRIAKCEPWRLEGEIQHGKNGIVEQDGKISRIHLLPYTRPAYYHHVTTVWTPSRASAIKSRSRLHLSNSAEVSSRASSWAVSRPNNNSDHNNGSWVEYLIVRLLQFASKFRAKHESQRMRCVVLSSFLAFELCTVSGRHDRDSTPPHKCTQ